MAATVRKCSKRRQQCGHREHRGCDQPGLRRRWRASLTQRGGQQIQHRLIGQQLRDRRPHQVRQVQRIFRRIVPRGAGGNLNRAEHIERNHGHLEFFRQRLAQAGKLGAPPPRMTRTGFAKPPCRRKCSTVRVISCASRVAWVRQRVRSQAAVVLGEFDALGLFRLAVLILGNLLREALPAQGPACERQSANPRSTAAWSNATPD
jgi:hypothetical protein